MKPRQFAPSLKARGFAAASQKRSMATKRALRSRLKVNKGKVAPTDQTATENMFLLEMARATARNQLAHANSGAMEYTIELLHRLRTQTEDARQQSIQLCKQVQSKAGLVEFLVRIEQFHLQNDIKCPWNRELASQLTKARKELGEMGRILGRMATLEMRFTETMSHVENATHAIVRGMSYLAGTGTPHPMTPMSVTLALRHGQEEQAAASRHQNTRGRDAARKNNV